MLVKLYNIEKALKGDEPGFFGKYSINFSVFDFKFFKENRRLWYYFHTLKNGWFWSIPKDGSDINFVEIDFERNDVWLSTSFIVVNHIVQHYYSWLRIYSGSIVTTINNVDSKTLFNILFQQHWTKLMIIFCLVC